LRRSKESELIQNNNNIKMRSFIASIIAASAVLAVADDSTSVNPPVATTSCETGASDILGDDKAFTVQVCNLFGATCYLNHPAIESDDCETDALKISNGECKLYPIYEYADNKIRNDATGTEHLSTASDLGCTVSTSNSNGVVSVGFSGACVSVRCSLGDDDFAGPAYRGTDVQYNSGATPVTDTETHTFLTQNFATLPANAKNTKTVFLSRTGDFVGTTSHDETVSNSEGYFRGDLPTAPSTWNYGPVACPSTNNAMDSATATGITAEDLRMCGSASGPYSYFFGVNLIRDADLYMKLSGTPGIDGAIPAYASATSIGAMDFLSGDDKYYSSTAMDDKRKVYLLDGNLATNDILLTSDTITPQAGTRDYFKDQTGGAQRSLGVAFYCKDYARTDLTVCEEEDQRMFYFCDPNPNACFGTATQISSNVGRIGEVCTIDEDCCSDDCSDDDDTCAAGCEAAGDYPTEGSADDDDDDDDDDHDGHDHDLDGVSGSSLDALCSLFLVCLTSYAWSA